MSFELIKYYYDLGLFSENELSIFRQAGYLTEEQMNELKGVVIDGD